MLGGSGHVSDSLIAIVLGPVCAALLVAIVVFIVVKLYASRRRRQRALAHGRGRHFQTVNKYVAAKINWHTFLCTHLNRQILTDCKTYYTVRIRKKYVIRISLKIPPHISCDATLFCEMSVS